MNRIAEVLKKAKIFQFLTVDGNKPRGRPFSFFMLHNGKLIFGTGTHKECWKQLHANPNVEILAFGDGEVEYVDDEAVRERAFSDFDYMKKLYNPESGRVIRFFTLKNATAEFCSPDSEHITRQYGPSH